MSAMSDSAIINDLAVWHMSWHQSSFSPRLAFLLWSAIICLPRWSASTYLQTVFFFLFTVCWMTVIDWLIFLPLCTRWALAGTHDGLDAWSDRLLSLFSIFFCVGSRAMWLNCTDPCQVMSAIMALCLFPSAPLQWTNCRSAERPEIDVIDWEDGH